MNTACEYADGFLVLTKEKLAVAASPAVPSAIHIFKGYPRTELAEALREWTITVYSAEELSEVKIERQVACAVLTAKVNGTERILAAFSNLCMKSAYEFVRRFQNLDKASEEDEKEEEEFCPKCGTMYPDQNRKVCPKCMDRKSVFLRTFAYFKPYSGAMAMLFVCIALTALFNLIWPYLSGTVLYDYVLAKNLEFLAPLGMEKIEAVTALTLLVGVMFVTKLMLQFFQIAHGVITAKVVVNVVRDMKKDVFRQMGKLSIQFFKSRQTGSLMTRVLSDADRVTGFFVDVMPYLFVHGFTIIATLVVMFLMRWQLALVAVVLMPVTLLISLKLRPRLWGLFGRRHRKERTVNSNVNDNLTGARVVKAFGQQENEVVRFEKGNRKLSEAEIDIVRYDNKFTAIFSAARELINLVVWALGVWFVLKTDYFEVGMLLTFTGYVGQLNGPINFFSRFFNNWSDSMNSAQRMFEILDSIPEIVEREQAVR
ncbi:MAG: ABC transporter transmembrane domain-containing protein, partial [Lachnospiraceae bacterium]